MIRRCPGGAGGCLSPRRDSLVNLLDFLPDLGVAAGAALELLHRQPEPQVLVAVLLLHVGQQLLPSVWIQRGSMELFVIIRM